MRQHLGFLRLPLSLFAIVFLPLLIARAAEAQISPISGNHSPAAEKLVGAQGAPADQMLAMRIDLNPSHRDELEALIAAQQDPTSPSYHRWLKTGEFDRRFGPDAATRTAIVRWLNDEGFEALSSTNGRSIKFNGSVAQAQRAFGVAISSTDGGKHFGNVEDPQVPTQFAGAIAFIDGLDNLRGSHSPMHFVPGSPAALHQASPLVKLNGLTGFGPADFYTFYDVNPLLKDNITGTGGGCIGLIEVSDYSATGIANFDKAFKLPTPAITKVVAPDSVNPGTNDRLDESMLDIEYAHTFAPGAAINFYLSSPATFGGNVIGATVDALDTAVADNSCSALSISIETCGFPNSYFTGALHTTYMKAASQGQTVFVAEGDEGAAEFEFDSATDQCVNGTSRHVNELASDPNVTAIGGTQFKPDYSNGNDVGFVPEAVWNEGVEFGDVGSGGGGASVVWPKNSAAFQATGTPDDGARDVPDISLEAACHTPGAFSVFPDQKSGNNVTCCVCGTSLGAPAWAGIDELMVQRGGNKRLGSINTQLYALGNMQDTAATGIRDVTTGNNNYNGVIGFDAVAGYDQASGWGTPTFATFVPVFVGATPAPTPAPIPGKLKLAPASLNFGKVAVNTTSKPKTVKLSNLARATKTLSAMSITIVNVTAPAGFATANGCTSPIAPGKSCNIEVTFTPTNTTPVAEKLSVMDDVGGGSTATVNLAGAGKVPK